MIEPYCGRRPLIQPGAQLVKKGFVRGMNGHQIALSLSNTSKQGEVLRNGDV